MGVQGRGSMPDLPLANCNVIITFGLPCARYSPPLQRSQRFSAWDLSWSAEAPQGVYSPDGSCRGMWCAVDIEVLPALSAEGVVLYCTHDVQ